MKNYDKYLLNTYRKQKVLFVKGQGKYLYDSKGERYLDFFCGISVCNLGHLNKRVFLEAKKQLEKLWHVSNIYYTLPQLKLAKIIVDKTFKGKIFFSNSGAEANECAIKIARKYGVPTKRYEIITFYNSFHGRTLATLTATGQEKLHKNFYPLLPGFKYAKLNDIGSVKKLLTDRTVAILVEPVQGEGGVIPCTKEFLKELRNICNDNKLLLMFDEVQTGFGRCGELFAYKYFDVKPDVLIMAKSIANGLPLGATLVEKKYEDIFSYGDHGSTFGGNLLSCAAACAVIRNIDKKLLNNVKVISKYFVEQLNILKCKYSLIKDVRAVGLMVGVELECEAGDVVKRCLEKKLVINSVQNNVLRFLPPLFIDKGDVDFCVSILDSVLDKIK